MISARARATILALSDERARHRSRLLAEGYEQYARGLADGYERGRRDCLAELAAAQKQACDHMMPALLGPPERELMIRRYGPRGHPGPPAGMDAAQARVWLARQPRPGDRRGGPVAPW